MLSVELREERGCAILTLKGELTFDTVPALEEKLRETQNYQAKGLILDLSSVDFLDSKGASALLKIKQAPPQNAAVGMASLPKNVSDSLSRMLLLDQFRIYKTVDLAIERLSRSGL